MNLAGDLIQSLAQYLNIQNLSSKADFPMEEKRCVDLIANLEQLENVKRKLNTELGECLKENLYFVTKTFHRICIPLFFYSYQGNF